MSDFDLYEDSYLGVSDFDPVTGEYTGHATWGRPHHNPTPSRLKSARRRKELANLEGHVAKARARGEKPRPCHLKAIRDLKRLLKSKR